MFKKAHGRFRRLALAGQSLVLMAIAAVTLVGMSALAVDSSGAWRLGSKSEQTLELAKDASMTSLNATKFSEDPGQTTADMVLDQMRQDGYEGDYAIWWYELGPLQTGTSDRLAGVEVQLDQTYHTTVASVIGVSDMDVCRNKIWTVNPYSSTSVWRPDRAQTSYGQVWRGHMGADGTTSSEGSEEAAYGDLSHDLQNALQGALGSLHGGGTDWRPPSYLEGDVAVSGDPVVNGALGANVSGVPGDAVIAYNWYLSDNADGSSAAKIPGEAADTLTLRPEWVGKTVICEAWDSSGAHLGTISSSPAGPIRPDALSGTLSVTGGWRMGDTVASSLADTPSGMRAAYQWTRDGQDIENACGDTYRLSPEDVGHEVACVVTDASGAFSGELSSDAHSVGKAAGRVGVTVSGDTVTGGTVSAALGGRPSMGETTVTWTWQRADSAGGPWADIDGADADSYSPAASDSGKWVRAVAVATNPYYELGATASDPFGPIEGKPLAGVASLEGAPTVSSTLTATVTGAQADARLRYQWLRDGLAIDGADGSSHVATRDDLGCMLTCQVSDASGKYAGNLVAGPVGPIEKTRWASLSARLEGDPTVGSTATVSVTGLPNGTNAVHYAWTKSKDGVETPAGDDAPELRITSDLNGYTLSCDITVDNDAYDVVGASVGPLGPITGQPLTGSLTISGSATYGKKLTCTVAGAPADATLSYQWSVPVPDQESDKGASYQPIAGKTGTELLCDLDLIGKTVTCVVSDASGKYVGQLVTDGLTVGKALSVAPTLKVSGAANVGSTLAVSASGLPKVPETTATFSWQVSDSAGGPWTDISGAAADSLAVGRDMLGRYVRCVVSLDNQGYVIPGTTSKVIGPIGRGSITGTVTVSADSSADGKVHAGAKLTASGTGLPDGATPSYRWSRDGAYIDGATGADYTTTGDDAGKKVVCHVIDGSGTFAGEIVSAGVAICSEPVAFAVYSDDDKSLDFYKRDKVPAVGDTFEGKSVTAVYTGVEHTSAAAEGWKAPWSAQASKITNVTFVDSLHPTSTAYWFAGMGNLATINMDRLKTDHVTNMSSMFMQCSSLTTLDLSGFDTSKVEDMQFMFCYCHSLAPIDVASFDTSKVASMKAMFFGCSSITTLDVSNFDTSKVTDMEAMFRDCSSITSLDVSNFDTSNVTDMAMMFFGCSRLITLDPSGFDTSMVTDMRGMFYNCSSLTTLDLSNFDTSKVEDMTSMFMGCHSLASIDVSSFDTANVTHMDGMFWRCSSIRSLDVSNFDTSKVTGMREMFYRCSSLTTLDLSNFDTSKVASMNKIFSTMPKLQTLVIGNEWNWVGSECYPPEPNGNHITGADGKWYAKSDGKGYAPSEIPNGKADTYYASKALLESAGKAQASIAGGMMPAMLAGRTPSLAMELGM